jgi:very-short-patch-repair endonuclease
MTSALGKVDERVPRARRLRRDVTDAERKLWRGLRSLPMDDSHFRRQAPIGPYFADFACHAKRLVIELDGGQHGDDAHVVRDMKRDAYMQASGYRVLRFWNNDVMQNLEGVLNVIVDALSASPPPTPDPSPPLRGGRGSSGTVSA